MAVQAQYPSNVLLLNRSVQEVKNNPLGKDYSLQPQPGGNERGGGGGGRGLLDQSHVLFNNGVVMGTNNARKRGREGTMNPLFSIQLSQQPSQLIDLSQLHTPPPPTTNGVSTGLRLAFGDQQQQQQQFQRQQQQSQTQQQQSTLSHQSSSLSSLLSEDLSSHIKQQRDEIEHFLHAQSDQLRRTLAERRQTHYRTLLEAAQESLIKHLKEKESEVEKATRHNAKLETRVTQLSVESQLWQAKARVQEAKAVTLHAQLQHAIMSGGCAQQRDKDEGGGCAVGEPEDAESVYVDPDRVIESTGPSCKVCEKRVASVVLLPCRHLCVCTSCDADDMVQACPICLGFKSSSVEVFLC